MCERAAGSWVLASAVLHPTSLLLPHTVSISSITPKIINGVSPKQSLKWKAYFIFAICYTPFGLESWPWMRLEPARRDRGYLRKLLTPTLLSS